MAILKMVEQPIMRIGGVFVNIGVFTPLQAIVGNYP